MHLAQSCRDGNQLANTWNEATNKSAHFAMLVKVRFGFLHFLAAQET